MDKLQGFIKGLPKGVTIGVLSVVGLLLLGTGVAYASDSSVPGDFLYSVDLLSEDIQRTFLFSDEAKVDFEEKVLEERSLELGEIEDSTDDMDEEDMAEAEDQYNQQKEQYELQLEELEQRMKAGDITEEEYESLKNRIEATLELYDDDDSEEGDESDDGSEDSDNNEMNEGISDDSSDDGEEDDDSDTSSGSSNSDSGSSDDNEDDDSEDDSSDDEVEDVEVEDEEEMED